MFYFLPLLFVKTFKLRILSKVRTVCSSRLSEMIVYNIMLVPSFNLSVLQSQLLKLKKDHELAWKRVRRIQTNYQKREFYDSKKFFIHCANVLQEAASSLQNFNENFEYFSPKAEIMYMICQIKVVL